jgi:K+/H+ antiporter YhaU regulatory subunit KhtT
MALKDTPIRRETKALVVAVRTADKSFVYNPDPDFEIVIGTTLIVLGETDSIVRLRAMVEPKGEPRGDRDPSGAASA